MIVPDSLRKHPELLRKPAHKIDDKTVEEIKTIASKYAHTEDFGLAKTELKAVAERINQPLTITEERKHSTTNHEIRHRTVTIGKKANSMAEPIVVAPYDPKVAQELHDEDLKHLVQHESPEHAKERRALHQ